MKFVCAAVLFTIMSIAGSAFSQTRQNCGPMEDVLRKNIADGYAIVAHARSSQKIDIIFFVDLYSGNFRVIGVDDNLFACPIAQGSEFTLENITDQL